MMKRIRSRQIIWKVQKIMYFKIVIFDKKARDLLIDIHIRRKYNVIK